MVRRAVSGGTVIQLAGVRLGVGDEFPYGTDLRVLGMHDDDVWYVGKHRDRNKIAFQRIGQLGVEALGNRVMNRAEKEVVAVPRASRGARRADRAAGARQVFDQELLAQRPA